MISVIGSRRVFILAFLLLLNAAMAGAVYAYLIPQSGKLESDLRQLKSDISGKQAETEKLKAEYQLIQEQKVAFEDLKGTGFLGHQDRVVARERIEAIRAHSRVLLANYNIMAATVEENAFAAQASHVVLNSPMSAQIDALDDQDFYSFIYWLENGFPGHIMVNNLEVRRENEVNDVTLRQVGSGVPIVMVKGSVDFEWRTVVPSSEAGFSQAEKF